MLKTETREQQPSEDGLPAAREKPRTDTSRKTGKTVKMLVSDTAEFMSNTVLGLEFPNSPA